MKKKPDFYTIYFSVLGLVLIPFTFYHIALDRQHWGYFINKYVNLFTLPLDDSGLVMTKTGMEMPSLILSIGVFLGAFYWMYEDLKQKKS